MKQKKYSFTLMEVMIGFVIISLVLGMIFSSLYQETVLKRKVEKMEKTVMTHVALQQFLDRVFANHILPDPQKSKRTLYTKENPKPNLSISFDNGIDKDPLFCGEVEGLLLIENGALVFKLWEGKPFERKVTLRKNVNHLSFEFLTNGIQGIKSLTTWDETYNFSPSFIKITLNHNEDYVFWVNQSIEGIPLKTKERGKA